MKSDRLKENSRVSRHGASKKRMPPIRPRAAKVLGKLLPALTGFPEMPVEIRTEFRLPLIDPDDDIEEQVAPGHEVDWVECSRNSIP